MLECVSDYFSNENKTVLRSMVQKGKYSVILSRLKVSSLTSFPQKQFRMLDFFLLKFNF